MEHQITDSLGHIITIKYDAGTDTVTINDSSVDALFHEMYRCNGTEDEIVCIDGMAAGWDDWSDTEARYEVAQFFWDNKVSKETSEDPR
jgi:hypothetical protein